MKKIVVSRLFNSNMKSVLNNSLSLSCIVNKYLDNNNYLYILCDLDTYYKSRDFYKILDKYKNNIITVIYDSYDKLINSFNREVLNGYEVFKKFSHELIYVNEMINIFDILRLNYSLEDYEIITIGYDYKDIDILEKNITLNNESIIINNYNRDSDEISKSNYLKYKNGIKRYFDLGKAIENKEVLDVVDEMDFCDNYQVVFNQDSLKGLDIIDIRKKSIIYKIIYDYIDNYYLNTGLYNPDNESDIGIVNIPKHAYDSDIYLSLDNLFKDKLEHHTFSKVLKK